MKTTKLIPILLAAMLTLRLALAQVAITEIMYAPNQTVSETDSEWIELYNTGPDAMNMTGWKIDNYTFDPAVLEPQQYLVVARELVDGTDADFDSFQSIWGTGINAVDGYFTLSNTGATIILTDEQGNLIDSVTYAPDIGGMKNGKTLEKTDTGWNESAAYGGTPGTGPQTIAQEQNLNNELPITLQLDNTAPEIQGVSYDASKIYATVYDANGIDEITKVYVKIANGITQMVREATTFKADLPELEAGNYTATVFAEDANDTSNRTITIMIDTIAAMDFTQTALAFANIKAGETKEQTVNIQNNGNVDLQLDFTIAGDDILQNNLQCYNGQWQNITQCSTTITAGEQAAITLKLAVPEGTRSGTYSAKLQTTATVL